MFVLARVKYQTPQIARSETPQVGERKRAESYFFATLRHVSESWHARLALSDPRSPAGIQRITYCVNKTNCSLSCRVLQAKLGMACKEQS